MKQLAIVDEHGNVEYLSIVEVMELVYFDIPNEELSYSTYSKKAYYDVDGWYLMDADGNKHYEDPKYLTF